MFRVGFGQDSHRFSEDVNKKLILGGIEIEGEISLEGNSDAIEFSENNFKITTSIDLELANIVLKKKKFLR